MNQAAQKNNNFVISFVVVCSFPTSFLFVRGEIKYSCTQTFSTSVETHKTMLCPSKQVRDSALPVGTTWKCTPLSCIWSNVLISVCPHGVWTKRSSESIFVSDVGVCVRQGWGDRGRRRASGLRISFKHFTSAGDFTFLRLLDGALVKSAGCESFIWSENLQTVGTPWHVVFHSWCMIFLLRLIQNQILLIGQMCFHNIGNGNIKGFLKRAAIIANFF